MSEEKLPMHWPCHKLVVRQATREILPRCNALLGEHPDILPG